MSKNKITSNDVNKIIQKNPSLEEKLKKIGLGKHIDKKNSKKRGVNTGPIFKSLEKSEAKSKWGDDWFAVDIPNGRILTYNEMFSILQYRKYEAFRYKKICRNVISRAINNNDDTNKKPFFNTPVKLTLVRIGKKEMDLDSLPVVFKYFIDSLKREGVIDDDNPNIIADIETIQGLGDWRLSLKIEKMDAWENKAVPSWEQMTKESDTKKNNK